MTLIHLIGSTYAAEMPSMAFGFDINNYGDESELMYMLSMEDISDEPEFEETLIVKKLPPGNWQVICTTKEVTEEVAAGIVQVISNGKISGKPQYRRYDRDPVKDTPAKCWTRDPRHALETLLTSKGLDPDKTLIIKKVS